MIPFSLFDSAPAKHWNYSKNNNLIGLDRSDVNRDWNDKTKAEKEEFRSHFPQWHSQFEMFCNEITRNDFVVAMAGYDIFLGFGTVNRKEYKYLPKLKKDKTFFDHVRQINWIETWDYDNHLKLSKPLKGYLRNKGMITVILKS